MQTVCLRLDPALTECPFGYRLATASASAIVHRSADAISPFKPPGGNLYSLGDCRPK